VEKRSHKINSRKIRFHQHAHVVHLIQGRRKMSDKKKVIIGTIGHIDHGKTTMSAAILKVIAAHHVNHAIVDCPGGDSTQKEKVMGMKGKYMSSLMAMAMMMGEGPHDQRTSSRQPTKEELDRHKKKQSVAKAEFDRKKKLSQGMSEFTFGKNKLWALNQKSANKKATKKGWWENGHLTTHAKFFSDE
jgi:hypothetical protein